MASSWRLHVALATLALLALVAACDLDGATAPAPSGTALDVAMATAHTPATSIVVITAVPVTVPGGQVQDCVDYVQFGAYVGEADMVAVWDAAGHDVDRLRENCVSLGRGDPAALAALSERRHEVDAYLAASSTTTPGSASSTAPELPG
ncbi:MAG: hypothetical protein AB7R77_25500 [Ilumatobacteraceae bacterium]